jgi:hypothetical protein
MGCTGYLNRVLSDPARQTVAGGATGNFEGGRGEEIATGVFDVLN